VPKEGYLDCDEDVHNCVVDEFRQMSNPTVRDYFALQRLPFDTTRARAVVADLRDNARVALTYGFGYESVQSVVWSPLARRFFVVFACC
jgi:hypothetical protein